MRRLSVIAAVLATVLVGLMAGCGGDPVSSNPVSPAGPEVAGLQISGPDSIAPGQSAQFTADSRMSDGSVKSSAVPLSVRWRGSSAAIRVGQSGVVTAVANAGEALVTAELLPTGAIRGAREVVIVPGGTYRLVGAVHEADVITQPVANARVEVTGTSISTTTDSGGRYRLYGVPAAAEIRVIANGYLTATRSVQLSAHGSQDFNLALSSPRISLNGPFTVVIDGSCSGPLWAPLQQRTYAAVATTTGASVAVVLTEPAVMVSGGVSNRFAGRADAVGVTFTLNDFYGGGFYYPYSAASLAERLPNGTYLTVTGTARTTPHAGGVSGPLNGAMLIYDSTFPSRGYRSLGFCSSGLRLTLAPR